MDMTSTFSPSAIAAIALVCGLGGAPAAQAFEAKTVVDPITGAVKQPFRDLNLIREQSPEALMKAADEPYAKPQGGTCKAVNEELVALDAALGPDLDSDAEGRKGAGMVSDLLKGATKLPFSGVVRRVTGAHKHQQKLEAAVVAGVARRGYLRGVAEAKGCQIQAAQPTAAESQG